MQAREKRGTGRVGICEAFACQWHLLRDDLLPRFVFRHRRSPGGGNGRSTPSASISLRIGAAW
jgi:hypothetical protein